MLSQLVHCSRRTLVPLRHTLLARAVLAGRSCHGLSTLPQPTLQLLVPSYMVWGANTDTGKTLVSAGLAAAASRDKASVSFLKPVQTGFPEDSDARLVALASGAAQLLESHAARLMKDEANNVNPASHSIAKTMFAWTQPVSPHVASETEGHHVSDADLQAAVMEGLNAAADVCLKHNVQGLALVETAGGPASPAPSGNLQCDCWRPLRLPAILVADANLGGISTSLSAYETLLTRGYDVPFIVMAESSQSHVNSQAIRANVKHDTTVVSLPCSLPEAPSQRSRTELDTKLQRWLKDCEPAFGNLLKQLFDRHQERLNLLNKAKASAIKNLWWPFTQHSTVLQDSVTVIDSRCGEHLAVYQPGNAADSHQQPKLQMQYDACASWWTQGVSGHLQAKLVSSMAHAAGRYGHVIFPENAHQQALDLAQKLLSGVGQGWADKVFFSDNGSTAIEVALKMGMRKYVHDRPGVIWKDGPALHVVGLTNGYHGDTLGAMDAVAQSPYNDFNQTPWFQSRGLFFDPPTCGLSHGQWGVQLPSELHAHIEQQQQNEHMVFESREELFSDRKGMQEVYGSFIAERMEQYENADSDGRTSPRRIASCILEPVLQGAGGMVMIDPAFQRALVQHCQQRNIPVIADEIFSGLWRLGHMSAAQLLGIKPDIACYAKLLTGGMLPLSATLANNSFFEAFQDDSKLKALLHGHSYTAHAIGCSAANTALDMYTDPACNPNLQGSPLESSAGGVAQLREFWDETLVQQLSRHEQVQKLVVLGTVFAAELKTDGKAGYGATEAIQVAKDLRGIGIYARPLGNVIYLMVTPTTSMEICKNMLQCLLSVL